MATWKKVVIESTANTITQGTTGNAATATALATGRNFSITGDVTASAVSFDGTGNVALSSTIAAGSIDESMLNATNAPTNDYILSYDQTSGGFTWTANTSSANDSTITLSAGTGLSGGGSFTTNQGSNSTVTFSLATNQDIAGTLDVTGNATFDSDVVVTGDLTVNGTTTTLNTATLEVEDKLIKVANVTSPTTTTANGAGVQVEASTTEAEWPELKWSNSGNLSGWSLSDYKATSNTDYPVSLMEFGTAAPSGTPDAGAGLFFSDTTNANLYIYI